MTDTITRRSIKSVFGLAVTVRAPHWNNGDFEQNAWTRGDLLLVRKDNGQIIATVSRDDLFDRDGNRFENDDA